MKLPNFFIVGAMKAGTTSLYFYLKEHPDVYMSPLKEPKFFAYDSNNPEHKASANYPITSMEAYRKLFARVSHEKAIGEASVSYLRSRTAAAAIRAQIPAAKFIISLRNPVDRAVSLYTMNVRSGREKREFDEAFRTDETWVHSGLYYEDIKYYLDTFGSNKIKILLFDDLKTNPIWVMKDIFSFLGVDDQFRPDVSIRHNPGKVARSKATRSLEKIYKKNVRLKLLVRSLISYRIRRHVVSLGRKEPDMATAVPDDTRSRMADYYHQDILKLQGLIGRDLSGWLSERLARQSNGEQHDKRCPVA